MFRTLTILVMMMVSAFELVAQSVVTNSPAYFSSLNPSVFQNDPKKGKDPFFPESTRRFPSAPATGSPRSETSEAPRKEPLQLSLKGIVVKNPGQKLALINNQIFAVGESKYLKNSSGITRITCVQIDERKVLVEIEGIAGTRELKLKEGH